jgi:hypothetical protein
VFSDNRKGKRRKKRNARKKKKHRTETEQISYTRKRHSFARYLLKVEAAVIPSSKKSTPLNKSNNTFFFSELKNQTAKKKEIIRTESNYRPPKCSNPTPDTLLETPPKEETL